MSGECFWCNEHTLDCQCISRINKTITPEMRNFMYIILQGKPRWHMHEGKTGTLYVMDDKKAYFFPDSEIKEQE